MIVPEPASHVDAPPLRERLVEALAYPRQSGPLSTLAAIAATHVVADWLPSLPSMVIDFIAWAAFLKCALEVLRWSANGRDKAPEFGFLVSESAGWFGVGVLIACQILVVVAENHYGIGAALAVGAAIALAVPAIMMLIAIEDSHWLALNPLSWLRIAARLRAVYLVPVVFFASIVATQIRLAAAFGVVPARFIAVFALHFAVGWLLLANFRLIGVLVHDRSDEFDYAGDLSLREETPEVDSADKVVASARTRAASGDAAGAAALLLDELRANPRSIGLHVEYRRWLREAGDASTLAAHGRGFIPVLLDLGQDARAVDIARESQQCDPGFALEEPADITRLATAAADAGQTQVALPLLGGFHKRFPGHPDIVRNYLLAAKLLAERMNKPMPARALLQQVKREVPDHPALAEVDRYLEFLDRVDATNPRAPRMGKSPT